MADEISTDFRQAVISPSAFIVALIFCVLLAAIFGLPAVGGEDNPSKIELPGCINPNNASAASLARLPGIGLIRARAIVEYREKFFAEGRQRPVFKDCNDLDKVKGIGPATVRKIKLWLEFK